MIPKVVNIHKIKGNRPYFDIYIGRRVQYHAEFTENSKWYNPFTFKKHGEKALDLYEERVRNTPELMDSLHELSGKILGCWCKPGPCHGDVLIKLWQEKFSGDNC